MDLVFVRDTWLFLLKLVMSRIWLISVGREGRFFRFVWCLGLKERKS